MATDFKEIEEYVITNWYNYNPPSIDQINLLHIENNIKLNRDTINEIIRRLGVVPSSGSSSEDQKIYDSSIYDTLINFKNQITQLQNDKLDNSKYLQQLGDFSQLQGGSTLVEAINNRLRKDTDDVSKFSYTFKKLTLTDSLTVGTTSTFTGAITAKSTLTASGKITANGGIDTTTLTASGAGTFNSTLSVSDKATLKKGITVSGAASSITGGLTVDTLTVTGNIVCRGNVSAVNVTASSNMTASGTVHGNILTATQNYLNLGNGTHKLYVQGSNVSLRNTDALIRTVS